MWGAAAQHVVSTTEVWRRSAALARRRSGAGRYVAVRYEDLVADPPAVVRRVCEAIELAYRPEMLKMAARPNWWKISGDAALSDRHDIYTAAVARHLRQLPPADACFIELRAEREMARWGYAKGSAPLTACDWGRLALRFAQHAAWLAVRSFHSLPVKRARGPA
jgi:hypothetical protein